MRAPLTCVPLLLAASLVAAGERTASLTFKFTHHDGPYLAQFVEPGTPLGPGGAGILTVAGAGFPFEIAADGNSVSIATQPDGKPSRRTRSSSDCRCGDR